jgi:adenylate cyclase
MEFRIGINLGDVVEEGDNILGDGVNVAARVQSLAEAGGISISGTAYDQIKKKMVLGYEYLGEHAVKNISEPVRVYRVRMEAEAASLNASEGRKPGRKGLSKTALAIIAVIVIAGAGILYQFVLRPSSKTEVASREKMAFPLPDKPSIAVLPFTNMSDDPKQEFFSDGITEEIITALSKVPNLFVIARNSTFTYKGKSVKIKQVSEELGVRYVLEGSVRKMGDKVRITAQLIDALSGHHLWADRYDRDLKDIFALQDEIALHVIGALQVKLTEGEKAQLMAKGTKNIEAHIRTLQGFQILDRMTREGNVQAKKLLQEAIALDPEYPNPYLGLALCHLIDVWLGTNESSDQSWGQAFDLVQKVFSLDESNAAAHGILAQIYAMKRQHEKAIAEAERGVLLGPNSSDNLLRLGMILNWAGRPEEAIPYIQNAIRLNPFPPASYSASCFIHLAVAYRDSGRYEKAIEAAKKALQLEPDTQFPYIHITVSYIRLGREEEARAAAAEILRVNPKFSLERYAKILPFPKPVADRVVEDLRKAGLK